MQETITTDPTCFKSAILITGNMRKMNAHLPVCACKEYVRHAPARPKHCGGLSFDWQGDTFVVCVVM